MTAPRALVGLLALSALPACGGAAAPAGPPAVPASVPPAAAPQLAAEVKQYRADIAPRRLSVAVTNAGDSPVVVTGVQLTAAGFEPVPASEVEVELAPGDRTDVKVPYGTARCDGAAGADQAVVAVRGAGELRLDVPEGNGLLERLRSRDCAEQALRTAVDLRLSDAWTLVGAELQGALVLERRAGEEPVTVVEPGGNVLFTIRPPEPAVPLGVLEPGAERVELPLRVTATRCDGHALAESKRSYVFAFFTTVGDGPPHLTATTADEALQRQLDRLALDTCRPGEPR